MIDDLSCCGENMISDKELSELFADSESDRVERKASMANPDRVLQAICAFANDLADTGLPGVVFIGQNDNLTCANMKVDDDLLLRLSHFRNDGKILPFPILTVERKQIGGCTVGVIIVEPSESPPVRVDGRTWVRVGPRRAAATIEEERRLTEKQRWRNLTFDATPFRGAHVDDLDLRRFETEYVPSAVSPELLSENGRTTLEKLRALRFISPDGVPNASALLLFGKDPRVHLPGAYIQFLRIDGKELTDAIVDQKEISGTLSDQIRQIEELLRLNIKSSAQIGSSERRSESTDYPIDALVQIIRNALLHRSYESSHAPVKVYWFANRIEFHNSGGLYGDVTPETIWKHATGYRNPLLAEALKALGFVERFGVGLSLAKRSLKQNGNPDLESEFVSTFVQFTVRSR